MRINTTDTIGTELAGVERRLGWLENAQRSAVAVLANDPANPRNGDTWLRTSDQSLRARINGANVTVQQVTDTGWQSPVYVNGWSDYAAPYGPTQYRRLNGVVYMRGLAQNGTLNSTIFNLPAGFRPANVNLLFASVGNEAFSDLRVTTTGDVIQQGATSNVWQTIACSFIAEQ